MYIFQTRMLLFEIHLQIVFRLLSKAKAATNRCSKNGLYSKGVCLLAFWKSKVFSCDNLMNV